MGGYEKLIFLDDEIDYNLKCTICFGVCEEATTACISGHTFCAACLQRADRAASNGGGKCPTCRSDKINAPNRPLRGMIDALRVGCAEGRDEGAKLAMKKSRTDNDTSSSGDPAAADNDNNNDSSGCKWEGKLGDWRDTHQKECPFVVVRCPDKCGKMLPRADLEEHKKECSNRKVECEFCHKMIFYWNLTVHKECVCPQAKVKCDYCEQETTREELGVRGGCPREKFQSYGLDINERSKVTGHFAVCPKMMLNCEFDGCDAIFKRGDAATHHAEKAQYHAALVNHAIDNLNRWDWVQMNWAVPRSKLTGSKIKVLRSEALSGASKYDLYLKLYLHGPGEPIKIAICSDSMNCCPVNAFVSLKGVELAIVQDIGWSCHLGFIGYEKVREVGFQNRVAGVFEFSSTLKRCDTESDDEDERDYTRLDMVEDSIENDDKVVIRANFYISKENRFVLSCDD